MLPRSQSPCSEGPFFTWERERGSTEHLRKLLSTCVALAWTFAPQGVGCILCLWVQAVSTRGGEHK